MTGPMILASSEPSTFLHTLRGGERVGLVPTAAYGLDDRDEIVEPLRAGLCDHGGTVVELELADMKPGEVKRAITDLDAVLVAGGNPFFLAHMAANARLATSITKLLGRGGTYGGISAGAMLAASDLWPVTVFSPFRDDLMPPSPKGQQAIIEGRLAPRLGGLGLVDLLVMPHDDRTGRRELHEEALRLHGQSHRLLAILDGESVVVEGGRWSLRVRPGLELRPAVREDAEAIAEVFVEAGRVGWAGFLSPDQLAGIVPDAATWVQRIESAGPDDITVAVDAEGVAGFIWVRQAPDLDLDHPAGEVATFYTHPRVWGSGVGQRLMALGLDRLRAMGYTEAVLWTEERNERPRRIYASSGWSLDGTRRTRDFHGFPITELRHRRTL